LDRRRQILQRQQRREEDTHAGKTVACAAPAEERLIPQLFAGGHQRGKVAVAETVGPSLRCATTQITTTTLPPVARPPTTSRTTSVSTRPDQGLIKV
jgi:hypothetical protein